MLLMSSHHHHVFFLQNQMLPFSSSSSSSPSLFATGNNRTFSLLRNYFFNGFRKRKTFLFLSPLSPLSPCIVCATDRKSEQFEVDPDKARKALQELDQQINSFSQKQATPPKIKVPEIKFGRNQMREGMPEISESFLSNSAVILFIFSIFYNVIFYTVIKPSIDGP